MKEIIVQFTKKNWTNKKAVRTWVTDPASEAYCNVLIEKLPWSHLDCRYLAIILDDDVVANVGFLKWDTNQNKQVVTETFAPDDFAGIKAKFKELQQAESEQRKKARDARDDTAAQLRSHRFAQLDIEFGQSTDEMRKVLLSAFRDNAVIANTGQMSLGVGSPKLWIRPRSAELTGDDLITYCIAKYTWYVNPKTKKVLFSAQQIGELIHAYFTAKANDIRFAVVKAKLNTSG